MVVKVAINGYGTIGKRVADAVAAQDDMEVVGVTKTRPTIEARMAIENGFPFYSGKEESIPKFKEAGIKVEGLVDDLLDIADIVVDCTPGKYGANNLEMYKKHGIKAIYQGGEKHSLTGFSFNSLANYEDALGKDYVRVVSCNTTGLIRTLYPLMKSYGIDYAYSILVRRAVDPNDSKKGPVNAIEPVLKVPSHHGPDVQSVIPDLNIFTMAVKVPTTLMHAHQNIVKLTNPPDELTEILKLWKETPRVKFVKGSDGITTTAQIMEFARDMGRPRCDLNEIAVWEDGAKLHDGVLYYSQAVHQESDVIPENIDAIRAMMEIEKDGMKSIMKTNKALGIQ